MAKNENTVSIANVGKTAIGWISVVQMVVTYVGVVFIKVFVVPKK